MKTVIFPFTAIDAREAEAMAAVWGPLTLLQPSADISLPETLALHEAGSIELLSPAAGSAPPVRDAMNAFEQWAAQHNGGDLAAMLEQGQPIPFFNSQSSTQLVAEIRKRRTNPAPTAPEKSADRKLFQARLLLAMAEKFDCQQAELDREIATLAAQERRMMALLKGEDAREAGLATSSWASGIAPRQEAPLIDLRLKAWARVMAARLDMPAGLSGGDAEVLFLTTCRSAMEPVRECFPEVRQRLQAFRPSTDRLPPEVAGSLPSWLAEPLSAISGEPFQGIWESAPGFDLLEIPDLPIRLFFHRLAGDRQADGSDPSRRSSTGSCWIGCLAPLEEAARETD